MASIISEAPNFDTEKFPSREDPDDFVKRCLSFIKDNAERWTDKPPLQLGQRQQQRRRPGGWARMRQRMRRRTEEFFDKTKKKSLGELGFAIMLER